ncbi:MAG: beta-galactosidase trimerization domain-containing protein [Candidatus Omnitrophota bacterium]
MDKKKLSVLVLAFFVGAGFVWAKTATAANLASNPGFEGTDIRWTLWPASEGPGKTKTTFVLDKEVFQEGAASARITAVDASDVGSLYSYVTLKGGKSYHVSFWYKLKDWQVSSRDALQLSLAFNKEGGANGSAGNKIIPIPVKEPTSGWKEFTTEITAPPETAMCQFIFSISGVTGTVWIDDVAVEEVSPVSSIVEIKKISRAPNMNGKLDDPAWKEALPLTPFYDMSRQAEIARTQTTAFLMYDDKNFYIAFKNTEPLVGLMKNKETKRDGAVWADECNEIFIAAPNGIVRQFIVSAGNVQWDGELYQKVPGDPWSAKQEWDGTWNSATSSGNGYWITEVKIPFSDFNQKPLPGQLWRINLARERHLSGGEYTHWNQVEGAFNNVSKFATLTFADASATLTRFVEAINPNPFAVTRKSPKFTELLTKQLGNYTVDTWGIFMGSSSYHSKSRQAQYTPEKWAQEIEYYYSEMVQAGMLSGIAFPWTSEEDIKKNAVKYPLMKYKFCYFSSWNPKQAVKAGAEFTNGDAVASFDPKYVKVVYDLATGWFAKNQNLLPYLSHIEGEDEPQNSLYSIFSPTANTKHPDMLLKVDKEIRENFGFGKYGLYDPFPTSVNPADAPFIRIAFLRWWNDQFANNLKAERALMKTLAPDKDYVAFNHNYTSGMDDVDVALANQYSDWVSADPYPTSAYAFYGPYRSLHHTGFSTKFIRDLSGEKKTRTIAQCFNYHGHSPKPQDIREWASQALKNGAQWVEWFDYGPSKVTIPDAYKEMLRVNNVIHTMKKLALPEKTGTAVFFSNVSRWGANDSATHACYTLYALLGEKIGSWFRFASDTQLKLGTENLSRYKLIYLPQIKYCTQETAEKLLAFAKNGGTLVVFDPEAFTWNIDGTRLDALRGEILGGELSSRKDAVSLITNSQEYFGTTGAILPLTPLAHINGEGKVLAYDIKVPQGAQVLANYPDGKPAAYARPVGKGKVIFFAAQPFGNSDLATKDSEWNGFLAQLAKTAGEKMDLGIWDFLLPETGGEVEVHYALPPSVQ